MSILSRVEEWLIAKLVEIFTDVAGRPPTIEELEHILVALCLYLNTENPEEVKKLKICRDLSSYLNRTSMY